MTKLEKVLTDAGIQVKLLPLYPSPEDINGLPYNDAQGNLVFAPPEWRQPGNIVSISDARSVSPRAQEALLRLLSSARNIIIEL